VEVGVGFEQGGMALKAIRRKKNHDTGGIGKKTVLRN